MAAAELLARSVRRSPQLRVRRRHAEADQGITLMNNETASIPQWGSRASEVRPTLERLAIERHHARASGRFAAVEVCGVFTKDLLDILRVQALQNITDRRVGGRPLP